MSFNIHQEVANYLAVRNRNRAERGDGGLPGGEPEPRPEPRPRLAHLWATLRGLFAPRTRPQPRRLAGQIRADRR